MNWRKEFRPLQSASHIPNEEYMLILPEPRPAFLQDIIKLGNQDSNPKSVKDAENTVQKDSRVYNTQQIRFYLEQLLDTTKNQEISLLQGIHQVLQEHASVQLKREDYECLKNLRLTYLRDDMTRIEQTKASLLDDSY